MKLQKLIRVLPPDVDFHITIIDEPNSKTVYDGELDDMTHGDFVCFYDYKVSTTSIDKAKSITVFVKGTGD